jgi:hypothetical protein
LGKSKRRTAAAAVLIAGIFMTAAGLLNGEHLTVFLKAVRICLECIGIG